MYEQRNRTLLFNIKVKYKEWWVYMTVLYEGCMKKLFSSLKERRVKSL